MNKILLIMLMLIPTGVQAGGLEDRLRYTGESVALEDELRHTPGTVTLENQFGYTGTFEDRLRYVEPQILEEPTQDQSFTDPPLSQAPEDRIKYPMNLEGRAQYPMELERRARYPMNLEGRGSSGRRGGL